MLVDPRKDGAKRDEAAFKRKMSEIDNTVVSGLGAVNGHKPTGLFREVNLPTGRRSRNFNRPVIK
jgi:hypothetical protein